jgi:hypothetical protein
MAKTYYNFREEMKYDNIRTIQIDFDGVIHKCGEGYKDGEIYDIPNEGALFTICNLVKHYEVVILTARSPDEWPKIKEWLKKYKFPDLEVTNIKRPALCYVDDKAIRFVSFRDLAKYYL